MSHPCAHSRSSCGIFLILLALAVAATDEAAEQGALQKAQVPSAVVEGDHHMSLLQIAAQPFKGAKQPLAIAPEIMLQPRRPDVGLVMLHVPGNRISANVTYSTWWGMVWTFPQRNPREFNVILATMKTWTADAVVQIAVERRRASFDWRRSFFFAAFGLLYIGLLQWLLYVTILTWIFPAAVVFANAPWSEKLLDQSGQLSMAGQIFVDNFIFNIFVYFPIFYMVKAIMQGTGPVKSRAMDGLKKYWKNILGDNLASAAVWIPADVVIFAAPMYLRMPLEHSVSFGWTMFMSATRGASDKADTKLETKS